MSRLRLGVVGVGALGRHHARILSEMPGVELTAVAETRVGIGEKISAEYGCRHYTDYEQLIGDVDAVCVVVPTHRHLETAATFLRRGIPVLVEKPLAMDVEQGRILTRLAENFGTLLQVGHIERFNPVMERARSMISTPRYIRAERYSPFPFRSMDIGVVLDVMIHDIDLVQDLCRSPVQSVEAFGISLMGCGEDIAQARIRFENGCIADLSASRVSPGVSRKMQIWSAERCVNLDFAKREVFSVGPTDLLLTGPSPVSRAMQPEADIEQLKREMFTTYFDVRSENIEARDALTAELQEFVDCVRNGTRPRCGGAEGLQALQTADLILSSMSGHEWEGNRSGRTGTLPHLTEQLRKAG